MFSHSMKRLTTTASSPRLSPVVVSLSVKTSYRMASTGAVTSTLRHVTDRKLAKLAEHQEKYETRKQDILTAVRNEKVPAERVKILIDGHKNHSIKIHNHANKSIDNIEQFLYQARHDPSVSKAQLEEWQHWLEHNLEIQSEKYNFAALFGKLLTEWVENPNEATLPKPVSPDDDFEITGRDEMYEQRKIWEEFVFTDKNTDKTQIHTYLDTLFSDDQAKKGRKSPLKELRESIGGWKKVPTLTDGVLKYAIMGILKADLFSGQKREALIDLQSRPQVLQEMVGVLQMDLDALETWQWEPSPVPLVARKQINGKYRIFMDEEIHQALLVHIIGMHFAVELKTAFEKHFSTWTHSPHRSIDKKDALRRKHFLGEEKVRLLGMNSSVRDMRRTSYRQNYFMTQLPSSIDEGFRGYDNDTETSEDAKNPMEIKQKMLRLITAEMLLNTKLYGQFFILQSDFRWFGPSLPHSTIYAVLEYFSVKPKFISFFKKFLETPVAFVEDGSEAELQVRKRGVPIGHILSSALGEAVLFCLDFAVNKKTHGKCLYRFHDDLWFWGQESACIEAWKTIQEFASVMGLELNEEKSAAIKILDRDITPRPPMKLHVSLPIGEVRWGFLVLDWTTSRWIVHQKSVEEHAKELQRQLEACRSVFAWVQAWNSYVARFFTNNFGEPSVCLGREHIDMVIEAFKRIQDILFGKGGNVADHLRAMITARFDVPRTLPDAFFYLPAELGGLEVRNPFVQLFLMRPSSKKSPEEHMKAALAADEEDYEKDKEAWDRGEHPEAVSGMSSDDPFMSVEEYTRFREQTSSHLTDVYQTLLEPYKHCELDRTAEVEQAYSAMPELELDPYWKWIIALYAGETMKRFGEFRLGEKGLLPLGLVSMLRSEKFRLQG